MDTEIKELKLELTNERHKRHETEQEVSQQRFLYQRRIIHLGKTRAKNFSLS